MRLHGISASSFSRRPVTTRPSVVTARTKRRPGATALLRTPFSAYSIAAERISASRKALAAVPAPLVRNLSSNTPILRRDVILGGAGNDRLVYDGAGRLSEEKHV